MRMGWTVWTTRDDHTSRSSRTLPAVGNELSITVTSSQLVSEAITVGAKRPTALDQPRTTMTWRIFALFLFLVICSSPLQCASFLSLFFFLILSNPSLEKTFRRNYSLILHCNPRWSELWCDQLLCNDPLMMGAPPVACCALTCVGPAKL